jgi:16S rRNA (guanine527-N7)-methyltransferase
MPATNQNSGDSAPRGSEGDEGADSEALPSASGRADDAAADDAPATLADALAALSIKLPEEQVAALDGYCRLLWDWNEKLNLTRHLDYRTFAARDVVDSLAFSRALKPGERILDVGTGGGVPGVVLAITRPDLVVDLCESVGKKARAVQDIVRTLGLKVPVHHARAEDLLAAGRKYDTLVIRAVARLDKLLTWFQPHWGRFGRMLVLKGPSWVEERKECRERGVILDLDLRRLHSYQIPGTHAESVLLQLTPKEAVHKA